MIYVERQLMLAVGNTRAYLRLFGMDTPAASTGMRNACLGASDSMELVLKITFNLLMHSLARQIVQAGNVATAGGLVSALSRISIVLSLLIVAVDAVAEIDVIRQPEGRERRTDLVYEGMVSYGNYRVFGAAENAKLYTGGVEIDRELWPNVFHTRVDGVVEFLPFVLLTQPQKADNWGNPLSRGRNAVPGAGITPVGFRLLWRDGKRVMPYFEAKGSVFGFTQKALSRQATYENWSFHLTQGLQVRLRGRFDLRLGMLSDLHISNAFVVRSNPALDVMNADVGLVYHLSRPRWPFSAGR